jgi:hypothetical protein
MYKNLDQCTQIHTHHASAVLAGSEQAAPGVAGSAEIAPRGERSGLRFPPTRAARASRSRGLFLEESDKGSGRSRWVEVLGALAALVVTALALAVCVNTTSVVAGVAFGANPGPAIVAAASVAPPFVLPVRLR